MYKKGDLKLTDSPCEQEDAEGRCDEWPEYGHNHQVVDSRGKAAIKHPCIFLPHSCQEWVIGGPEEIRAMIEDLTEALKTMEAN